MLWVVGACFALVFVVPPLVGFFEGFWLRAGPRDVGFWALARRVEGSCHARWGGRLSPVVSFPLQSGAVPGFGWRFCESESGDWG